MGIVEDNMDREYFKGVVWPRNDGPLHRYVIVGMLVSEKPIPEFEGKNEILIDGPSFGASDLLLSIRHRESNFGGDAVNVLLSLKEMNYEDTYDLQYV